MLVGAKLLAENLSGGPAALLRRGAGAAMEEPDEMLPEACLTEASSRFRVQISMVFDQASADERTSEVTSDEAPVSPRALA